MRNTIIPGTKLYEIIRDKVKDAILAQQINTLETVEFYIVNLLQEFHNAEGSLMCYGEDAIEKPLAILLLEAMSGSAQEREHYLRRVGDTTLVISGFFGDNIHASLMAPSYYISIGESAYGSLAYIHESGGAFSEIYRELSTKFSKFVDVISMVAPWNRTDTDSDILRIYERWIATGDETLKELLEREGILLDKLLRNT